jgi:N-acetylglucosamine repressor
VINGQLYFGDGHGAGEIGHVVVQTDGPVCRCGHRGCLEAVVSSGAIVRRAQALATENPASALHRFITSPADIGLETICQAFEAGDDQLTALISEIGYYLGIAVANLIGALNIHRVVIAGDVARFGLGLMEPITEEMHRRSLAPLADETHVAVSRLGSDIVILGGAALLLANELGLA